MLQLLISLTKQNNQSTIWNLIRWTLLALLPHQRRKVISAIKGDYLDAYHLYGMAETLRFCGISNKASNDLPIDQFIGRIL